MKSPSAHTKQRTIRNILIGILLLNWAVALAKIFYGLFTRTASMTADGLHSLSDGASNIIGIIGIHFAFRPLDEDHPYGHRKYETFFSLAIAMLLFVLALGLIHKAWERWRTPVLPEVNSMSFVIMITTMIVNFFVMRYEHGRGKALRSDILIADSLHTKADIFTSLSVISTLIFIKLGYPLLDPIATLLIALFIAHAGIDIVKTSSAVLCDSAAQIDSAKLTAIIHAIPGVKTFHKIRARGQPDDIHIDLHVQVDPAMSMERAHRISDAIEETIKKQMPEITDVVVHMEPLEG